MGWGANTVDVDFMNRKVTVQFFNDDTGVTLLPVVVDIPADAQADWFTSMVTDRIIQLDTNSRAMVGITKGFVIPDEARLSKLGIATAKDPAVVEVTTGIVVQPPIGGTIAP